MKYISNNAIDDAQDLMNVSLSDGEIASSENPPAAPGETAAAKTAAPANLPAAGETAPGTEGTDAGETASDTAVPETTTNADSGGISGGESSEGTLYTEPSPAVPNGGGGVQMPVALLAALIAVICVLAAVTVFLIVKLKKGGKNSGGEDRARAAERPADIAANPSKSGGTDVSGMQPDPEKNEEKGAEKMVHVPEIPVTVVPGDGHFGHRFSYEIGNVHNQGRREEQQDSFCISDVSNQADLENKGLMAVVADGMGGLESGASVSQLVSNIFLNKYRSSTISDCKSFLYEAVMESEREVEKYIEVNHVDGGSTLVAVMIREGQLSFISVGDSFIFLIRAGKLIKLNTEHTYGNLLRERAARGEIDPEEAEINPKRASLTSYIGIGNLRLIDRSGAPIPVMDGDILFLCSDGVYNALGDNALLEVVTGGDFGEAAERVEQSVLMQNIPTQDNFTAVMIKITGGK